MFPPIEGWTKDPEVIRLYGELLKAYYRAADERDGLVNHNGGIHLCLKDVPVKVKRDWLLVSSDIIQQLKEPS